MNELVYRRAKQGEERKVKEGKRGGKTQVKCEKELHELTSLCKQREKTLSLTLSEDIEGLIYEK